ncbi:uncharacterized protein K444DRAFT_670634 [Hyaloscypha bicolor E]|uniref:CorA-like transporter domain-containing protein n=1 Tax=Hyaloscypha bicolor E TaxID=1095630 RepID=A0A2J6SGA2_9HELO|nr:uncharacterized protein K444DRAFT_670634 [Hyaloscypha bicolor E]PMD49798.1 hypothetical protein K444DRAFT_670634 [Hyaloscypha bicolor E]
MSNDDAHKLFGDKVQVEILSISNDVIGYIFSWGYLNITQDAFNKLLVSEQVFEHYNKLVKTFGQRIRENNNAHLILHEICYNVYHVEKNHRQEGDPWSMRETAVYHKLNIPNRRSNWIFVQIPQAARTVLEQLEVSPKLCIDVMQSKCLELHIILISAISTHWSEYIDFLGGKVDVLDVKASYSNVEDISEVDYSVTFTDCQSLYILQRKLRKARRALECCQDLARGLEDSWLGIRIRDDDSQNQSSNPVRVSVESAAGLHLYAAEIASHIKNIIAILERSYSIGNLLSKILELRQVEKSHKTSQSIEKNIVALEHISTRSNETSQTLAKLARENNKGSLTLKTLTLIATIYLPATLSATIFSSDAVQTTSDAGSDLKNSHFVLAPDFWVFMVVTLGFTLLTLLAFLILRYAAGRSQKQRNKDVI